MENGTEQKSKDTWRMINPDGSFNVSRSGVQRARLTDFYHWMLSMSWLSFLSSIVAAYLILNLMFGVLYFSLPSGALEGVQRFEDAFFFSVQTLATIGYGKIVPVSLAANLLVTAEALVGLLGFAFATGLLFSRFARPTARVVFSRNAILSEHDGMLSLVFRIANQRLNQISDAEISVWILKDERTREGEVFRTFNEVRVERSKSPVFMASWTVVHPIDGMSPLYGMKPQDLIDSEVEVLVALHGTDATFSEQIYSRYSYTPSEILWGGRFVDMLRRENGMLHVELGKIHDVEAH